MAHTSRRIARRQKSQPLKKPTRRERIRELRRSVADELRVADVMAVCIFGIVTIIAAVFGYAALVIASLFLLAAVAYVCGKNVRAGSQSAPSRLLAAAVYSMIACAFFTVGALIRGAGSVGVAASLAAACLVLYVTVTLECALCKNIGGKRISVAVSFAGLYLLGVPILLLFALLASRVQLAEVGGSVVVTAFAAWTFALLYAITTALRLCYMYFILRHRLRKYKNSIEQGKNK